MVKKSNSFYWLTRKVANTGHFPKDIARIIILYAFWPYPIRIRQTIEYMIKNKYIIMRCGIFMNYIYQIINTDLRKISIVSLYGGDIMYTSSLNNLCKYIMKGAYSRKLKDGHQYLEMIYIFNEIIYDGSWFLDVDRCD